MASYGNHTMHHLQGFKVTSMTHMRDITEADRLIDSHLLPPAPRHHPMASGQGYQKPLQHHHV